MYSQHPIIMVILAHSSGIIRLKPLLPKLVRSNKNAKVEKASESYGGITCHFKFLFALLTKLTIKRDRFLVAVNDAQIIVFFKITGVIFFGGDE